MPAIITSLYAEAAPYIKALHLKQTDILKKWTLFQSEDRSVLLLITGTGRLRASAGVSVLLSHFETDHLYSITSAASLHQKPAGSVFLISKTTDLESGRSFYPDLLEKTDLEEAFLLTSDQILGGSDRRDLPLPYDLSSYLKREELQQYDLLDMEGSAVFLSASKYLGPHQIHLIRIVSDQGNTVTKEQFAFMMQSACGQVLPLLKQPDDIRRRDPDIDEVSERLCCSASMKQQLKQLVLYCRAAGISFESMLSSCMEKDHAESREEGKKVLHELTKRIAE